MQKITPFLWFDHQAEEAMQFYTSVFSNSKVGSIARYGDAGPGPKGSVMTATFELDGQAFVALNGGPNPDFKFTPAISFVVNCDTQQEIDTYWDKLSQGGRTNRCGWLTDKFGVTWQIVPSSLGRMVQDKDVSRVNRVMQAVFKMDKLDIATLERAYG